METMFQEDVSMPDNLMSWLEKYGETVWERSPRYDFRSNVSWERILIKYINIVEKENLTMH